MFTGIVEATGKVEALKKNELGGFGLEIAAPFSQKLASGASLAVNGCCLTVTEIVQSRLQFDLLGETLRRTNLGDLRPGDLVNLERPMAADGRFDGHLVQGHIDTTAAVLTLEERGSDRLIEIELPSSFQQYVVFKGSVAVDGISLTIAELHPSSFVLWIIPHTWEITNLQRLVPGALVNLEFDLIAKYVERQAVRGLK
ncbi:MAG TPA: riboflavin synthase [Chthoniobacterales bacterium]|jgi:riboflavin synthase|nr:riboflavin synthase [Chthoniobacterales bacterium]